MSGKGVVCVVVLIGFTREAYCIVFDAASMLLERFSFGESWLGSQDWSIRVAWAVAMCSLCLSSICRLIADCRRLS